MVYNISDKLTMIWIKLNSHMTEAADHSPINTMILGVSLDFGGVFTWEWIVQEVNFPRDELS